MGDDTVGKMLGWSLGQGFGPTQRFDELVEFPTVFCFKVVGHSAGDFLAGLLSRVASVLGRQVRDDEHTVRASSQGRYQSVTLKLYVTSGEQVYSLYQAMGDDDRVKLVL